MAVQSSSMDPAERVIMVWCRVVLALVSSIMEAKEASIADATFRNACKVFGVSA